MTILKGKTLFLMLTITALIGLALTIVLVIQYWNSGNRFKVLVNSLAAVLFIIWFISYMLKYRKAQKAN